MTRRPRILHVGKFYAPHKGGIETHLQLLCGELVKRADVQVVVANSGRGDTDERIAGVPVRRKSCWANVAAAPICPGMAAEIRESQADIVHLHLPNPAAILAYLASGHRGALVCSYHSDIVRQKLLGAAFEPFQRAALGKSAAIIAATPNYIQSSPTLRSFRGRCHVIPYGIPLDPFDRADPSRVRAIQRQYGPRLIVAVGRLVYYKGFQYLIRAMKEVDGKLLLVGTGPLKAELEAEVQANNLQDRVVFLGGVEDINPYYHAADLFVLPAVARSEAFGIVQIEAMACRKPVINTNLDSGVTYVSVDGVTGLTVPPAEPAPLAAAVNRLLADPELRARYGAAARVRVEELFTLEAMTGAMLRLYSQVCPAIAGAFQPTGQETVREFAR